MVATINALCALIVGRRFPKTRGVKRHRSAGEKPTIAAENAAIVATLRAEPETGTICEDVPWNLSAILVGQESIGERPCGFASPNMT